MRIGQVTFQDLGPFADVTHDFSLDGLTVIEGEMVGMKGSDDNGSGKSFMFDLVAWVLYDRCIREKYKGDDLIRLGTKGASMGEVHIVGGPQPIRVVRYRKHKKNKDKVFVFVGGKSVTRGTNPETNAHIVDLLGMDFDSFVNCVAFGAREDVKSFFAATDSARKDVLERILGLEAYGAAEQIARRRLRAVTTELNSLNVKRTDLSARLSQMEEDLQNVGTPDEIEQAEMRLLRQRALVQLLRRREHRTEWEYEDASADYDAARAVYDEIVRDHEAALDALRKDRTALRNAVTEAERTLGGMRAELRHAKEAVKEFEQLSGTECPTCKQTVTEAHSSAILDKRRARFVEAETAYTEASCAVDEAEEAYAACPEPVAEEPTFWPLELETDALNVVVDRLDKIRSDLDVESARLGELETATAKTVGLASKISDDVTEARAALADVEQEYIGKQNLADQLQFWVDGFGNKGLKSYLIEAEVPTINKLATGFAQRLLGDGTQIRISATKQLKSRAAVKDEITIEARIPGKTNTYYGASKGQKLRLDVSLVLALRTIVASRTAKSFDQLFADEIFDGLDATGSMEVLSILKETAGECPVAMVSHDIRIKSHGDRLVTVRHADGVASLISSAGGDRNPEPATPKKGAKRGRKKV